MAKLAEQKQASVSGDEFQHLYFYEKDHSFFRIAEKAISRENWSQFGDFLLQILSAGYDADVMELVMFCKQCDNVLRSYGSSEAPVSVCDSPGEFSSLDAEAEREEEPLSEAEADFESGCRAEPTPQDAALGDVSVPGSRFSSLGVDGAPSQLVPADRWAGACRRLGVPWSQLCQPHPSLHPGGGRARGSCPPSAPSR